jgi:transcriptional regulator of aromatic amino acid metabolism
MAEHIATRLGSDEAELLSALKASMADAVYAVDAAGVVLFANAAAGQARSVSASTTATYRLMPLGQHGPRTDTTGSNST